MLVAKDDDGENKKQGEEEVDAEIFAMGHEESLQFLALKRITDSSEQIAGGEEEPKTHTQHLRVGHPARGKTRGIRVFSSRASPRRARAVQLLPGGSPGVPPSVAHESPF